MYRISFIVTEIPSQLIGPSISQSLNEQFANFVSGKKLGPDLRILIQVIVWSIWAGCQFFIQSRAGFFACRFFIGLFMGGSIPDSILYIS